MNTDTPSPEELSQPTKPERFTIQIPLPQTFIYSNCASYSMSHMDIRIGFAEALPDGHAEPRVGIVMPPEAAAQLALALWQQINMYERHFGELRQFSLAKARAVMAQAQAQQESTEPKTTPE